MSDDDALDSMDDDSIAESGSAGGSGKGGGFKAKIQQFIPLILAVVIGVTLSSVISYVVIGKIEKGRKALPPHEQSNNSQDSSRSLAYFTLIEQIRTRTADKPAQSLIVTVQFGYDEKNEVLFSELSKRTSFFTDQIRNFFSNKTAAEMTPELEALLKSELKMRINDYLITEPGIENVIFPEFQIIEM